MILPAGLFNQVIVLRTNCRNDEAFRADDRAPAMMILVFGVSRDWLCSVQAS